MNDKKDANYWADHWRFIIGANVIPADTRSKTVRIIWKQYQNAPIPKEQHDKWKEDGAFNDGIAVIAGKIWHNPNKTSLNLICLDFDNQLAIDEFCTRNGVKTPLEEIAKKIIIEGHKDQKERGM